MQVWPLIKPLVRALRVGTVALAHLILYSRVWNPPGPIITGEKQTKKGSYNPTPVKYAY